MPWQKSWAKLGCFKQMKHQSVLLQEVITGLEPKPGETVLDLTLNRGGHSLLLCEQIEAHGRLIGLDADSGALVVAGENLKSCPCPVTLINGNFRHLAHLLDEAGVGKVDVVLADLGLSSEQLAEANRGFSFQQDAPLQMTLNPHPTQDALTAELIVNNWSEETLADVIYAYGEEPLARKIASAIVTARRKQAIHTTGDLVEIIKSVMPLRLQKGKRHFATKTFQALRIVVNDELGALREMLASAWERLNHGGRLAVITFHSLEAREVKTFFQAMQKAGSGKILTRHAVKPSREELLQNPRSRSAQLRIIKKV